MIFIIKNYSIKEVAKIIGINPSKIRYYERREILTNIKRDKNNNRIFSEEDIELLLLIICLSNLNMPLKEIREKINNLNNNFVTVKSILFEHRTHLEKNVKILRENINSIDIKINSL